MPAHPHRCNSILHQQLVNPLARDSEVGGDESRCEQPTVFCERVEPLCELASCAHAGDWDGKQFRLFFNRLHWSNVAIPVCALSRSPLIAARARREQAFYVHRPHRKGGAQFYGKGAKETPSARPCALPRPCRFECRRRSGHSCNRTTCAQGGKRKFFFDDRFPERARSKRVPAQLIPPPRPLLADVLCAVAFHVAQAPTGFDSIAAVTLKPSAMRGFPGSLLGIPKGMNVESITTRILLDRGKVAHLWETLLHELSVDPLRRGQRRFPPKSHRGKNGPRRQLVHEFSHHQHE
jgi:hypothetical protein